MIASQLLRRAHRTRAAEFVKSIARRMIDGCVERYLRINCISLAGEVLGKGHFADSARYEACDYPFLRKCLGAMELSREDVVFEIGCGLGRALCLLARRGVKRCVGIELSEELAAGAVANVRSLRGPKAPTEVLAMDAAFADYSQGTAFFLFHPFGGSTMRTVLERIRSTLESVPRIVRIMYINPVFEEEFRSAGWLQRVREIRSPFASTWASYWVSRPEMSSRS